MSIQILKGGQRQQEERIGRYMQEIREIVQRGFERRELLNLGLVMGGAGLLAMRGMWNFQPYWAHADDKNNGIRVVSPPNTPFIDPLPIPAVVQKTMLDPAPTKGPNRVTSTLTGFTETHRPPHQLWTQFGGSSDTAPGFTGSMCEILELPVQNEFYPAVDGVPSSTIWAYVDASNNTVGPLWIRARYG
ncbi:MAG TPA: hypothetical protein VLM91_21965 [Candidatus Methylomirabilis sp.]|nr:hypothetical protein [Candidatus Methylomirabilis sp.]